MSANVSALPSEPDSLSLPHLREPVLRRRRRRRRRPSFSRMTLSNVFSACGRLRSWTPSTAMSCTTRAAVGAVGRATGRRSLCGRAAFAEATVVTHAREDSVVQLPVSPRSGACGGCCPPRPPARVRAADSAHPPPRRRRGGSGADARSSRGAGAGELPPRTPRQPVAPRTPPPPPPPRAAARPRRGGARGGGSGCWRRRRPPPRSTAAAAAAPRGRGPD